MKESYWRSLLEKRLARRRALAGGGGAVLGAALLAACGGDGSSSNGGEAQGSVIVRPADSSKQAKRGGTLKISQNRDTAHFDPAIAQSTFETPQKYAFGYLTTQKAGFLEPWQGDFTGDVAESWEPSGDGLQMTFKLRPGVLWHNKAPINGRALDADDVVFSWDRFEAKGASRTNIANAANPDAPVLDVSAPDQKTIVVKLKYPVSFLPGIFSNGNLGRITLVPKETDSSFDIRKDIIGTGPFQLANYQTSVGYTFKRNPDYWDKTRPYVDEVDMPLILEYAQGFAQFRTGALYHYSVRPEDVLSAKRDMPVLNMYQADVSTASNQVMFGWLPAGKSPFLDERVRQAYSMSLDRDLFIETFYNVSTFESEGLPIETRWNTALPATNDGWWIDPKSKEFGPNAKYFQYNLAEAKKLLAAAGYANGLDVISSFTSTGYGTDHVRHVEVLDGMAAEAGFRIQKNVVENYTGEFIPKYRDGKGNYEGWSFKAGPTYANDPLVFLMYRYYSKSGDSFFGFDAAGKSDNSGDPQLDAMMEKARSEFDDKKRREQVAEIQRFLAGKMYAVTMPGGASGFSLTWPVIQNWGVFNGELRGSVGSGQSAFNLWLDTTKAPIQAS